MSDLDRLLNLFHGFASFWGEFPQYSAARAWMAYVHELKNAEERKNAEDFKSILNRLTAEEMKKFKLEALSVMQRELEEAAEWSLAELSELEPFNECGTFLLREKPGDIFVNVPILQETDEHAPPPDPSAADVKRFYIFRLPRNSTRKPHVLYPRGFDDKFEVSDAAVLSVRSYLKWSRCLWRLPSAIYAMNTKLWWTWVIGLAVGLLFVVPDILEWAGIRVAVPILALAWPAILIVGLFSTLAVSCVPNLRHARALGSEISTASFLVCIARKDRRKIDHESYMSALALLLLMASSRATGSQLEERLSKNLAIVKKWAITGTPLGRADDTERLKEKLAATRAAAKLDGLAVPAGSEAKKLPRSPDVIRYSSLHSLVRQLAGMPSSESQPRWRQWGVDDRMFWARPQLGILGFLIAWACLFVWPGLLYPGLRPPDPPEWALTTRSGGEINAINPIGPVLNDPLPSDSGAGGVRAKLTLDFPGCVPGFSVSLVSHYYSSVREAPTDEGCLEHSGAKNKEATPIVYMLPPADKDRNGKEESVVQIKYHRPVFPAIVVEEFPVGFLYSYVPRKSK